MNTNKKMKYKVLYLFLAFFVLCGSHLAAQTPEYRWGRYFNGNVYSTGSHYDIIHSTAFDSAGNVYVFGRYGVRGQFDRSIYICPMDDTVGFQQADKGYGCFLAKFDTMGTLLWCKSTLSTSNPMHIPLNMVLKDGTPLVANVKNPLAVNMLVGLCQFVKIPPDQVTVTTIQELICQRT